MGDGGLEADATGGDEANGMLQKGLRADVGKKVAEAALAQEIDVQQERGAEPGNTDNFAPGTHRFHRVEKGLVTGEALFGTAPCTFENDIRAIAVSEIADG